MPVSNEHLLADPKPINHFLAAHRKGALGNEMAEALRQVVHAVSETGKSGSVTITINVKPAGASEGVMEVTDKVTTKLPENVKSGTIMYVTPNLELQTQDPNQTTLELKQVSGPTSMKEVGGSMGPLKEVG